MQNVSSEWSAALDYVSRLSNAKLYEFFYQAVNNRRTASQKENGDFEISSITIAESSFGKFNKVLDGEHYSTFVALPTVEEYEIGNAGAGEECLESGDCEQCKAHLTSVAKRAICPICFKEASLT